MIDPDVKSRRKVVLFSSAASCVVSANLLAEIADGIPGAASYPGQWTMDVSRRGGDRENSITPVCEMRFVVLRSDDRPKSGNKRERETHTEDAFIVSLLAGNVNLVFA